MTSVSKLAGGGGRVRGHRLMRRGSTHARCASAARADARLAEDGVAETAAPSGPTRRSQSKEQCENKERTHGPPDRSRRRHPGRRIADRVEPLRLYQIGADRIGAVEHGKLVAVSEPDPHDAAQILQLLGLAAGAASRVAGGAPSNGRSRMPPDRPARRVSRLRARLGRRVQSRRSAGPRQLDATSAASSATRNCSGTRPRTRGSRAACSMIEARRERVPNPDFDAIARRDWRRAAVEVRRSTPRPAS